MRTVVLGVRGRLSTTDRRSRYSRAGVLAFFLPAVTGLQLTLFEPRTPEGLVSPALDLVVVIGTVSGVVAVDGTRSEPQIYRTLVAGLALLGASVTTELLGEFLVQAALFTPRR